MKFSRCTLHRRKSSSILQIDTERRLNTISTPPTSQKPRRTSLFPSVHRPSNHTTTKSSLSFLTPNRPITRLVSPCASTAGLLSPSLSHPPPSKHFSLPPPRHSRLAGRRTSPSIEQSSPAKPCSSPSGAHSHPSILRFACLAVGLRQKLFASRLGLSMRGHRAFFV